MKNPFTPTAIALDDREELSLQQLREEIPWATVKFDKTLGAHIHVAHYPSKDHDHGTTQEELTMLAEHFHINLVKPENTWGKTSEEREKNQKEAEKDAFQENCRDINYAATRRYEEINNDIEDKYDIAIAYPKKDLREASILKYVMERVEYYWTQKVTRYLFRFNNYYLVLDESAFDLEDQELKKDSLGAYWFSVEYINRRLAEVRMSVLKSLGVKEGIAFALKSGMPSEFCPHCHHRLEPNSPDTIPGCSDLIHLDYEEESDSYDPYSEELALSDA